MQFRIRSVFVVVAVVMMAFTAVFAMPAEDLQAAASGHEHGRVQIKVYRGPSDHEHAPWGFWVKQPADDEHH